MSASVTGEWSGPLVQRLNGRRAVSRASSPASRITASSGSDNARTSLAGNGEILHAQRWRIGTVTEFKVIGRGEGAEHVKQVPSDRDLAHGISAFAIFNPETRCTAAVVARYHVCTDANQISDVEPVGNIGNQLRRAKAAWPQM